MKLMQCPHCKQFGTLILNGTAKGYAGNSDLPITRRHRVVCNARRKSRKGCGGSLALFKSTITPRFRILTSTLLVFAALIARGISAHKAFKKLQVDFHRRAATRWRNKIILSMSFWREKLSEIIQPIHKPRQISALQESLNHFKKSFTKTKNFFAAFQLKFNCSIV